MSRYVEIDMRKIATHSIRERKSKFQSIQAGKPVPPGSSFREFWDSLPQTLAAQELDALAEAVVSAASRRKPVLFMMGAHVIKVGLSPVVVDLMEAGLVRGVSLNGAGVVHDVELAYFACTSEDVSEGLRDGSFGMARETSDLVNGAVQTAAQEGLGFGEALGKRMSENPPEGFATSILGQAFRLGIPATVHVALGTDIVHQHPSADGAAIGEASLRDFRILANLVSQIGDGGVVILFGSSVILPEVFLKALTVARNVTGSVERFVTANFDMIRHYRPFVNMVQRPTQDGGRGFNFIGHHEILMPLLAASVKEKWSRAAKRHS